MAKPRALILDLDGTLLSDEGEIHPHTRKSLHRISKSGVRVMVATGRSEQSAAPAVDDLGIPLPAVIYNGAAIWCPKNRTVIRERLIDSEHLDVILDFAHQEDLMPVVMCADTKRAFTARPQVLKFPLHDMKNIEVVSESDLRLDRPIRLSVFSERHENAAEFAEEIKKLHVADSYMTWFPLNLLPELRNSPLKVVDIQPACEGKKEALNYLEQEEEILPEEVVAIGDAPNDIPMVTEAGLGIAMGNAMSELKGVADKIIGTNDTGTIGELVDELWPEVD